MPDRGRTVALCLTGGIAAYKAVVVARLLLQRGVAVQPVMTTSAARFVGKVTLSGICGRTALDDMWDPRFAGEAHVALADEVDVIAIVPATADVLARLAEGRADDLVTALALVARTPIVVAPAMHPRMWAHPATRRNVAALHADAQTLFVGPVEGLVASGDVGVGRMAEPDEIVDAIVASLASRRDRPKLSPRLGAALATHDLDFVGRHVVVTAGPTLEDLDPVRFLGNRSTGKMGFAIASAGAARGARVTLVAGPVHLPTPAGVDRVDIRSALDMQAALDRILGEDLARADALVMAAAVADHRPVEVATNKSKKTPGGRVTIELEENPDLLAALGARRTGTRPVLVGFAVETDDLVGYARRKLASKRVDLVVANLAAHGFGGDDDRVVLVDATSERPIEGSKRSIADAILDAVRARLE